MTVGARGFVPLIAPDKRDHFVDPGERQGPQPQKGAENDSPQPSESPKLAVGGILSGFVEAWRREGAEPWVLQVLTFGYQIPFVNPPPLSRSPRALTAYAPNTEKFLVLEKEVQSMIQKHAIEEVTYSFEGFYNRLFVVAKASGGWRPVLDVSSLNKYVSLTKFTMESPSSVLSLVRRNDWMITVDLQDAYFQVPIHPESRKYLRFVFSNKVYQFKALCFGLCTAPQVFTRVFASVAKVMHLSNIRVCLYLDDWLVLAETLEGILRAKQFILDLAAKMGFVINYVKSCLEPQQEVVYLGMLINSVKFWVFPTEKRVNNSLLIIKKFLDVNQLPAHDFQVLLGHMSSMERFVPGARLRSRLIQFHLKENWDMVSLPLSTIISIPECLKEDLRWWFNQTRLSRGVTLTPQTPHFRICTDASLSGWGASLGLLQVSGTWSESQKDLHINILELMAIKLALQFWAHLLQGKTVVVQADNSTALSYLKKGGGHQVQVPLSVSQGDFDMGGDEYDINNDMLHSGLLKCYSGRIEQKGRNSPKRMVPSPSSMQPNLEVVGDPDRRSVCNIIELQASSLRVTCSGSTGMDNRRIFDQLGSPVPLRLSTDKMHPEHTKETSLVRPHKNDYDRSMVAPASLVPRAEESVFCRSQTIATQTRSPPAALRQRITQRAVHSLSDRVATLERQFRAKGYSLSVARRLARSLRPSSLILYQCRWKNFRKWCLSKNISAMVTSPNHIMEYFIFLRDTKKLSLSSIKGYRAAISSVQPWVGKDEDISLLIKAFEKSGSNFRNRSISWNLDVVLKYLLGERFEPLSECSTKHLTMKALFLLALASAKRISEVQAISKSVGFRDDDCFLSYIDSFVAKTERPNNPIPRSFKVIGLKDLTGDMVERKLCPVRALKYYLQRLSNIRGSHNNLFCSVANPSRPLSKNAIAYFLKTVIKEAHEAFNEIDENILKVKAHEIRAMATTLAFKKNISLDNIIQAANWRTASVFATTYLKDISINYDNLQSIGPLVAVDALF